MRINVGVLFGGKSVEHEVSIISAIQMMENMNKLKYQPIPIYLSKDNTFYYHEDMVDIEFFKNMENLKKAKRVLIYPNQNKRELLMLAKNKLKKITDLDLIFLVVHGALCEDGTLSSFCELLNIPYVGSAVLPSALNQNKWKFKTLLKEYQVPLVPYFGFYEYEFYQDEKRIISECEKLGMPLIVKPATLGSSVGIKKCANKDELIEAIISSLQYDTEVIVEPVVQNLMELNCSVLGKPGDYQTSEIERVIQFDDILSYADKYLRSKASKGIESTCRELPAQISPELKKQIAEISLKAAEILGISGVVRIDYLYDQVDDKLYLNEINTIPGSLAFYLWKAKGMSYSELIDKLIEIAFDNYRVKNSKIYSYDTNILALAPNLNSGKLL
ncbi:MAG: D-alanine--D-alanine ligase [Bacilli bacterium]|nr:D-alanine--D-alanine ligase [Bacilli bacterium]